MSQLKTQFLHLGIHLHVGSILVHIHHCREQHRKTVEWTWPICRLHWTGLLGFLDWQRHCYVHLLWMGQVLKVCLFQQDHDSAPKDFDKGITKIRNQSQYRKISCRALKILLDLVSCLALFLWLLVRQATCYLEDQWKTTPHSLMPFSVYWGQF